MTTNCPKCARLACGCSNNGVATTVHVTEERAMEAIANITIETEYPPTPDELSAALGAPVRNVHSALQRAKRDGSVAYNDEGRLYLT